MNMRKRNLLLKTFGISLIMCSLFSNLIMAQIAEKNIRWKKNSGAIHVVPLINCNLLYYGSMDSNFYALNVHTGKELWHFKTAYPITSNAAIKDDIVCFTSGNKIYGLNAKTGRLKWNYIARNAAPSNYMWPSNYHRSSPVIYNRIAYFGDDWGYMNGVNIKTGKLAFQYHIKTEYPDSNKRAIACKPAIKQDIIYFGDYGANVYAVSIINGREKWIHKMNTPKWDGSIVSEMVIKGNQLWFGRWTTIFSPISLKTGEPSWTFMDSVTYLPSTPVFYHNNVIIASTLGSSKIHCLNKHNGSESWYYQGKGIFFVKPIIIRDSILVINSTDPWQDRVGVLYFINCNQGSLIDSIKLNEATESSPVVIGNTMFLGRNDGMYAINYTPYLEKDTIANNTIRLKSSSVTPKDIIGSDEITIDKNASIAYPNPFETFVNFHVNFKDKTNNAFVLTIISEEGKQMYLKQYKNSNYESIIAWNGCDNNGQAIKSGIYFYTIKCGKNELNGRLIKK
jgi:outer membrane protein assembly factor BamB